MTSHGYAAVAADAVRDLNHHLATHHDADSGSGLAEVYEVLADLTALTSRLPQALSTVNAHLRHLAAGDGVVAVDEHGNRHDPALVLAATGQALTLAAQAAHTLTAALDHAHEHVATLATDH